MVLTPSANDKVGIFVLRFVVRCWLTYLILRHSHIWDHLKFLKPGLSTAALSEVLMLESSTGSCLDWVSVWVFTNILWHKASYLFMVSSVRCLANSLQGCDRGKPTLLVRRRNTRLLKKDLDINSFFFWKGINIESWLFEEMKKGRQCLHGQTRLPSVVKYCSDAKKKMAQVVPVKHFHIL